MSEYDNIGVQYILDNYNLNALKQMDDEELYQLVYETCDMLSWANEECDFGTFGENYERRCYWSGQFRHCTGSDNSSEC